MIILGGTEKPTSKKGVAKNVGEGKIGTKEDKNTGDCPLSKKGPSTQRRKVSQGIARAERGHAKRGEEEEGKQDIPGGWGSGGVNSTS